MLFAMLVAASVALVWTVLSSLTGASGGLMPRDPSTLELLLMAVMTLAAYNWAKRQRVLRDQPLVDSPQAAEIGFSEGVDDLSEDAA